MNQSIYFRNFFATALIVLISFVLLGGLYTAWVYNRSLRENEEAMERTIQEAARYIVTQHVFNDVALNDLNLSMLLSVAAEVSGFDIIITNIDGIVYACSERGFRYLGKQINASILEEMSASEQRMIVSSLDLFYEEQRFVMGMPLMATIDDDFIVVGYIFLSSEVAAFEETWRGYMGVFVIIAICVMILAFGLSVFTIKRQVAPINEMASVARRFTRGDFSMRAEDKGRTDELGQLMQAFNAMADSLENSETFRRNFIANLSHELKTPMTVIAGFAEGLLDGTIPKEKHEHYLEILASETRRLSRLVESMLDMATFESPEIAGDLDGNFDITEVARLALLSLSSKIDEKKLDVVAELPEKEIITFGDKDTITQVIYNLLDNAIKYSAPNGLIGLSLWKQDGRAYVSVENDGETIPSHELPHIFERFHKIDKSRSVDREGVGLGLYIVKTILDKHNQDIFVTSTKGHTQFVFTLSIA